MLMYNITACTSNKIKCSSAPVHGVCTLGYNKMCNIIESMKEVYPLCMLCTTEINCMKLPFYDVFTWSIRDDFKLVLLVFASQFCVLSDWLVLILSWLNVCNDYKLRAWESYVNATSELLIYIIVISLLCGVNGFYDNVMIKLTK